jgi:F0F1-type ATP synthase assembly protein I
MSKAAISPFRWITPSQLVICLILFFLPWVEIQCQMPRDFNFKNPNAKFDPNDLVWTPVIHQSGLQVATGQYSFSDSEMQKEADQHADQKAKQKDQPIGQKAKQKDQPDAAPLLWVFLAAVVAGILIGFFVPSSAQKKGLLIVCCLVALGMAGGQAVIGFPITQQIKEQLKVDKDGNNGLQMETREMFKSSLKIPFYLTLLFCAGAIVTTLLEPVHKPRKRQRIVEEDDDEDRDDPPAW